MLQRGQSVARQISRTGYSAASVTTTYRLASGPRGARSRLFLRFPAPSSTVRPSDQLGDAVVVTAPLIVAFEEALQAFQSDVFPAGDEFGLQLVLPGGLGCASLAREDFADDLGLELRRERPTSAFRHGR